MLGGKESKQTLEPIDPSKVRSMRNGSVRAMKQSTSRLMGGVTPSLQSSGKFEDGIGGTPGSNKRRTGAGSIRGDTMRQSGKSVGKFGGTKMGASTSNFGDGRSVKTGSVRDPKDDDSFDLEDFDDIIEKI